MGRQITDTTKYVSERADMIFARSEITLERSPQEVWDFLMEPGNQARWQNAVLSVRTEPEGPIGLGTKYFETRQLLGKRFDLSFVVSRFDPPGHSAIELTSGPFTGGANYTLQEDDGGTRMTLGLRVDVGGFFKLAEPVVRSILIREMERNLQDLKVLVEAPAVI